MPAKYKFIKVFIYFYLAFCILFSAGCYNFYKKNLKVYDMINYCFVVAADPQLFGGARKNWQQTIREINSLSPQPDFVIVCGDITEPYDKEEGRTAYITEAKKLNDGIKLYNVAGNHDVDDVTGGDPTLESLGEYESRFGPAYYYFEHKNSLFVVLNSSIIKTTDPKFAHIAEEQIQWLMKVFEDAISRHYAHKFVFIHHPIIIEKIGEEEQWCNLSVKDRNKLLTLFRANNVNMMFSGHIHQDRTIKLKDIELVVNGSCGKVLGNSDLGFRIVKVSGDNIEHVFYKLPDQTLKYQQLK
jgi:serine/threonine-protein phosphatase CPPED1